jgi:hypothetical protein
MTKSLIQKCGTPVLEKFPEKSSDQTLSRLCTFFKAACLAYLPAASAGK